MYLVDVVRGLVAAAEVEESGPHRLTLLLLPGPLLPRHGVSTHWLRFDSQKGITE